MAGGFWGADVAQLRELAQTFGKASDQLLQQSARLGQVINAPAWKGPDGERFRSEWNSGHRTRLMNAASELGKQSRFLIGQADQQEKASAAEGGSIGGAGGTASGTSQPFQLGPNWLADGKNSPFRQGWTLYGTLKAYPDLRAGIYDMVKFVDKADSVKEFFSKDFRLWAKEFQKTDLISSGLNSLDKAYGGDPAQLLNLAEGGKAAKFFEVGGKALGGIGVGLDALDAVNSFSKGDGAAGAYSLVKAGLGAACFAPPPVGTAAMVASGALALYDNVPIIHDAVNATGKAIADVATTAWNAEVQGAKVVAKGLVNTASSVLNAGGDALKAAGDGLNKIGSFFGL